MASVKNPNPYHLLAVSIKSIFMADIKASLAFQNLDADSLAEFVPDLRDQSGLT